MNVLEMTDLEIYETAITELTAQLGHAYTEKFLQQCKPNEYDYSIERHKILADQPDIDTIVERIQQREAARKEEKRVKAERVAAWRKGSIELTDIEIHELAVKILIDKFDVYGFTRFFQQCQEINRGYPINYIQNKEDAEKEIALYTAGLTLNPKMVEGYIKRGNAYSYIGEYDKAIVDYSEAIKLKPDYAEAYNNRARTYLKKVDFDKAIEDYTKAIELNPQDVDAYYTRGKLYDMNKSNDDRTP
jgi:tetratricopeptide (TPR) repeat protein